MCFRGVAPVFRLWVGSVWAGGDVRLGRVGLIVLGFGLVLILFGAVALGMEQTALTVRFPGIAFMLSPFALLIGSLLVIAGEVRGR